MLNAAFWQNSVVFYQLKIVLFHKFNLSLQTIQCVSIITIAKYNLKRPKRMKQNNTS